MSSRTYRFWVDDDFIDKYAAHLSPPAFRVYIAYCRHQNAEGLADISVRGLCAELRLGKTQAVKALNELVTMGLLAPARSARGNQHAYQIVDLTHPKNVPTVGTIPPQERSQGKNDTRKQDNQRKRLELLREQQKKAETVPTAGTFPPQERYSPNVPTPGTKNVPTVGHKGFKKDLREEKEKKEKKDPSFFSPGNASHGGEEPRPRTGGISGTDLSPALSPACADANSSIQCPHMVKALDLIETKLGRRPYAHPVLHAWIHTTGHTLEDLALMYDYRLSKQPDPEWLRPANVCSPKNDYLALAQQWAANGRASPCVDVRERAKTLLRNDGVIYLTTEVVDAKVRELERR